jgi:hypothetical protein
MSRNEKKKAQKLKNNVITIHTSLMPGHAKETTERIEVLGVGRGGDGRTQSPNKGTNKLNLTKTKKERMRAMVCLA